MYPTLVLNIEYTLFKGNFKEKELMKYEYTTNSQCNTCH